MKNDFDILSDNFKKLNKRKKFNEYEIKDEEIS
jgi:hypothetical protein